MPSSPSSSDELSVSVDAVRHFNRFYTRHLGVLQESFLEGPFSLTEARVLYELDLRGTSDVGSLSEDLGLDPGYLSRLVGGLEKAGLVTKRRSSRDRRVNLLSLSAAGREAFVALRDRSNARLQATLEPMGESMRARLVGAMDTVRQILDPSEPASEPYLLRPHRPGDLGWVVQQHGRVYGEEYGWTMDFEGLVAEIAGAFARNFDPDRERCWIAERDGENVGSVFLVRKSDDVAQLRLLIVDRRARGLGIGRRLVQECTRFARQAGYRSIVLWTDSILHAARHIYESEGYVLVGERPHRHFGQDLVGQDWELTL